MRRTNSSSKKTRVKILEARKQGMSYEEIRRKYGVSPNTISRLVRGKSLLRYCRNCGETAPETLEEHHPHGRDQSSETVTLCANCHSEIHRKQPRERKEDKPPGKPTVPSPSVSPTATQILFPSLRGQESPQNPTPAFHAAHSRPVDLKPLATLLGLGGLAGGGYLIGDALWGERQPKAPSSQTQISEGSNLMDRLLKGGFGLFLLWLGIETLKEPSETPKPSLG